MSKKRASPESNNDEKTNEDSETPLQRDDNAKREKLDSLNDITIQDLPFELLECILVKAVVMEVKDLKLVKSVWREKAYLAIIRLTTVCPQWSNIITTDCFRTKLHRILDDTAQTNRMNVLLKTTISSAIKATTTLKNNIFVLYAQDQHSYAVHVFNRNGIMKIEKDIIPLPKTCEVHMTGCNASNCVYVSVRNRNLTHSVFCISEDVDGQFKMSPWESDHRRPVDMMRVSANGSLMILSVKAGLTPTIMSIYDAIGSLQHEITLPPDSDAFLYRDLLLTSSGNLVVAYVRKGSKGLQLFEIDVNGSVVRQCKLSDGDEFCSNVMVVDNCGRIFIANQFDGIELLDSEFNHLCSYTLQEEGENEILFLVDLRYDSERNEIVSIHNGFTRTSIYTVSRLIED